MDFSSLIEPERVLCNVEVRSRKHAFEVLSELLSSSESSLAANEIFNCLMARERLGSTTLGNGVAIPHCRMDGIAECYGAFVKLSEPIVFGTEAEQPVLLLCGIIVPRAGCGERVADLGDVTEALRDDKLRDRLLEASGSRSLYELLASPPAPHGETVSRVAT